MVNEIARMWSAKTLNAISLIALLPSYFSLVIVSISFIVPVKTNLSLFFYPPNVPEEHKIP